VFFLSEQDTPQDRIIGNFLKLANFTITIDGLKRIDITALNESNKNIVTALLTLTEGNKEKFTATMALALQFLISNDYQCFKQLKKDYKVKIIDFMMCQFTTEESIEEINGVQSAKNICVSFLRRSIFSNDLLDLDDFQSLENIRIDKEDVWTNRIADKVEELKQQKTDKAYSTFSIVKIKNYILSNAIVSKEDFFNDIVLKLEALRSEIEGDRDNDKKSFYNQDGSWKYEGACRDIILHRLKDKYGYDLLFTKEKYEADNRVDINIKYKANTNYEVQIECKRDGNSDIYKGIPEQLIHKYFSPKVFYGVLLIFYFGEKKDKNLLLKKIDDNNPVEYKNNIKVVCIDLIKKRADGQDE